MNRLKPHVRAHLIDWLKQAVRQTGPSIIPAMSVECRPG